MSYIEQKVKIMINDDNLQEVKKALTELKSVGALIDYDRNNTKDDISLIIDRLENGKFVLNKDRLNSKVFESIRKYYECNNKSTDSKVLRLIKHFELDNCSPIYWIRISKSAIDSLKFDFDSVKELILYLQMIDILAGYPLYDLIIESFPDTDFSYFLLKFDE